MNLIELPNSPFWGINVHVGFYPTGKRRYSMRSTKIRRDEPDSRDRAMKVAVRLQDIANEAMEGDGGISRERVQAMVESLLRIIGRTVADKAPAWDVYSLEVLERHCRDVAPATRRSYFSKKSAFEKWLADHPRLSPGSSLADFRLADIQEFYDHWIEAGGASTTVNAAIEGLSLVFERAVVEDFIPKNPCKGVVKRDSVSVSKQPFTLDDLSKLTRVVIEHRDEIEFADEWALAIRFSMFTGARSGDACSLRWDNFSDDFRTVRFVPQKKQRIHDLKKVDASLTRLLPEFVAAFFRSAHAVSDSEFVTPNLKDIHPGKQGRGPRFREIMDLAGIKFSIKPPKGNKGAAQCSHSFHSLRGTIKTELRADGVSDTTNALLTGHEDLKVSARYITERAEAVYRECSSTFERIVGAIDLTG